MRHDHLLGEQSLGHILAEGRLEAAIGQAPDLRGLLEPAIGVVDGHVATLQGLSPATAVEGVFAGGDCAGAEGTVVDAMAAGRLAAEVIDDYLAGRGSGKGRSGDSATRYRPFVPMVRPTAFKDPSETTLSEGSLRPRAGEVSPELRRRSFVEIAAGISEEQATAEARRCMKYDRELEAESAARLADMGPAAFVLCPEDDPARS